MEGVFTYLGAIFGHGQMMFVAHLILVTIIVLLIAKMATKSLRAVPNGTQNVMEAYLGGVIAMGKDVIGEEMARKYLPLVAARYVYFCIKCDRYYSGIRITNFKYQHYITFGTYGVFLL